MTARPAVEPDPSIVRVELSRVAGSVLLLLAAICAGDRPAVAQTAASGGAELVLLEPTPAGELGLPPGWESVEIPGRAATDYRVVTVGGLQAVRAVSRDAASGLFRDVLFDPASRRRLRWRWRVAAPVDRGDGGGESADDYVARIFILFGDAATADDGIDASDLRERPTLCYVWADGSAPAGPYTSPYVDTVRMIAVRRGAAGAGEWVAQERDLVEDYRHAFGREPEDVLAVGIMTDTDDTDSVARAWYGAITVAGVGAELRLP